MTSDVGRFQEENPGPGDTDYTYDVKKREIVSCLKYLAVQAIEHHELELARDAINAAKLVNEIDLSELADESWGGL